MSNVIVRSVTTATNDGSSPATTLITPDAQANDAVVVITANDLYTADQIVSPVVTGNPAVQLAASADGGSNFAHVKAWLYLVNTPGPQIITETENGLRTDEEKHLIAYVLGNVDPVFPLDGAAGAFGAAGSQWVAPSVDPSAFNSLLLVHMNTGGGGTFASFPAIPGAPFIKQYELHTPFTTSIGGTEQLTSSGPTGTRVFTPGNTLPWAGVTLAIRAAIPPPPPVTSRTADATVQLSGASSTALIGPTVVAAYLGIPSTTVRIEV